MCLIYFRYFAHLMLKGRETKARLEVGCGETLMRITNLREGKGTDNRFQARFPHPPLKTEFHIGPSELRGLVHSYVPRARNLDVFSDVVRNHMSVKC